MSERARIVAVKDGDRVRLTVEHNGQMVVQFRLTEDQALKIAGDLLRATGKEILIDSRSLVRE
jgi:hypothetical protein